MCWQTWVCKLKRFFARLRRWGESPTATHFLNAERRPSSSSGEVIPTKSIENNIPGGNKNVVWSPPGKPRATTSSRPRPRPPRPSRPPHSGRGTPGCTAAGHWPRPAGRRTRGRGRGGRGRTRSRRTGTPAAGTPATGRAVGGCQSETNVPVGGCHKEVVTSVLGATLAE